MWQAADTARYWAIVWTGLGVTALLALLPAFAEVANRRWLARLAHPGIFAGVLLVSFLAWRWPTWFAGPQPNPDEAHMIAGAITLRDHPAFWRDVDGTTHGPLNDYALLPVIAVGLSLDLVGARFTGSLLAAGALLAVWLATRRWLDDASSRLALLPALVFWGGTSFWDFFQYSSELVPLSLTTAGGALGSAALRIENSTWRRVTLAGAAVALGLVPYAKLQAVPLAVTVGVVLVGATLACPHSGPRRTSWLEACWLIGGAVAPTLLLLLSLAASGLMGEFYQSYIKSNLLYAGSRHLSWGEQLKGWSEYLASAPGSAAFFYATLWAALLLLVPGLFRGARPAVWTALGWVIAIASFITVLAPGRAYLHYLHFLVPGAAFLLACSLGAAQQNLTPISPWIARAAMVVGVLVALVPQMAFRHGEDHPFLRDHAALRSRPPSSLAARLNQEGLPGDRLAVWGWRPMLHVETGLPQGTRDGQTQRMIETGPMTEYYRDRFLKDFLRNKPRWFVDAVGPGNFAYEDRRSQDHRSFRGLAHVVREDYELLGEFDGCRLYRRKDFR